MRTPVGDENFSPQYLQKASRSESTLDNECLWLPEYVQYPILTPEGDENLSPQYWQKHGLPSSACPASWCLWFSEWVQYPILTLLALLNFSPQ